MELKLFYKSQKEVALVLNKIIDTYLEDEVSDEEFVERINTIVNNNKTKIFKDEKEFVTTIVQRCGKRRLDILIKVLNLKI